jgi:tRNA(adenine34) deaminase
MSDERGRAPAVVSRMTDDESMDLALAQARLAGEAGEVPVGCVIVHEGNVIARAHNLRETIQDPTAHAELIALRDAAKTLGTWRLSGATCFVTLEPCPMCAGALVNARVDRVVYATEDPKAGATTTLYTIGSDLRLNHRFALTTGVRRDEASDMLKKFFGDIRRKQKDERQQKKP